MNASETTYKLERNGGEIRVVSAIYKAPRIAWHDRFRPSNENLCDLGELAKTWCEDYGIVESELSKMAWEIIKESV